MQNRNLGSEEQKTREQEVNLFKLANTRNSLFMCTQHTDNSFAFTLAEVLITLGVIGVVAAITMPMLISNINERVNSERQANIVYKVTQAMEHMRATGKLIEYDSTESFVNELQKHLKIQKICDKNHLAECWPTEKVTTNTGREINIADVTTSERLGFTNRTNVTNNVGLILADGASLILNYNTQVQAHDIGDIVKASTASLPVGNHKSKVFQYTTNVTDSIAFVTDVNGKRGPNSETIDGKYYDIRSFNGAKMDNGCVGDRYGNTCIYFIGKSYPELDCSNPSNPLYSYCNPTPSGVTRDYWAGGKYTCNTIGMSLPTVAQLETLRSEKSHYPSISSYESWFMSSEESTINNGAYKQTHIHGVDMVTDNVYSHGKTGTDRCDLLCISSVN